jgi:hypothetical protein
MTAIKDPEAWELLTEVKITNNP